MKQTKPESRSISIKILCFILIAFVLFGFGLSPVTHVLAEGNQFNTFELNESFVPQSTEAPVVIYFFWGEGCPHCAEAKPVLAAMVEQNPRLELRSFEVYSDPVGIKFFNTMMKELGFEPRFVPTFIIGDQKLEGYNEQIRVDLETAIATCLTNSCTDRGAELYAQLNLQQPTNPAVTPSTPVQTTTPTPNRASQVIKIPLVGTVDLSKQSLFLSTLLIAFIDGVNPCSIWVLTMLLSITLHTGSRKKILIVGFVFISVTAFIYALFIAGLFTVFSVINFMGWIRVVVALVAVFFGLINIKDYFWYKEGFSLTIDDKSKPGLYKQMRKVSEAGNSMWGLIGGTIILAAGVSLVEFSCTAGFPVLWTNMLTAHQVTVATFVALLLVYMFIYQLDELGIFLAAVFTFKSSKIEEKHGRILKLIGGTLMVTLAGVMLINPAVMNNLADSLVIFAIAFGAAIVILILHRYVLPRFGIHIGTEEGLKKKTNKSSRRK